MEKTSAVAALIVTIGTVIVVMIQKDWIEPPWKSRPTPVVNATAQDQPKVVPTTPPQVIPTPLPAPGLGVQAACPNAGEVQRLIGSSAPLNMIEACGFAVTSGSAGSVVCPAGWMCTFDTSAGLLLVKGLNSTDRYLVGNGTWRYVEGYGPTDAVRNPCALLPKERGARAVNFTC